MTVETSEKSIQTGNEVVGQVTIPKTRFNFDVVKRSRFWLGLSILLTIPGLIFMVMSMATYSNHAPLKLGIDFTGGLMTRLAFVEEISQDDLPKMSELLTKMDIQNPVVQLEAADAGIQGKSTNLVKTAQEKASAKQVTDPASQGKKASVSALFSDMEKQASVKKALPKDVTFKSVLSLRTRALEAPESQALKAEIKKTFGDFTVLEENQIGPTLAKELFVQAGLGLLVTFGLIVVYLTVRFQMDYAITALIAMFHDAIFLIGTFSILGWFFNMEVNSMFVTAILTVIGFSVHDTIVVFDRVRENIRKYYTLKLPFSDIINFSVNQTFARSINTSLTALITLSALFLFGGEATKELLLALILGIAAGTYSSIFVASPLLAWWRNRQSAKGLQPASA